MRFTPSQRKLFSPFGIRAFMAKLAFTENFRGTSGNELMTALEFTQNPFNLVVTSCKFWGAVSFSILFKNLSKARDLSFQRGEFKCSFAMCHQGWK